MKDTVYFDIQSIDNKEFFIEKVLKLMEKEYPNYVNWFKEKLIPGLEKNERNIVIAYKDNQIIGFLNIKNTKKEKKISNIYINSFIFYKKHFNNLINIATELLETNEPTVIISKKEFEKSFNCFEDRQWKISRIVNTNNNVDMIFNGDDQFEVIKKYIMKKQNKNKH